jgi:uncharacterized membrane protein
VQQRKNQLHQLNHLDLWLLLAWFAMGMILRLTNLADKPASSIEIATLGFSLGHSFTDIPLDRLISASTLLSPLKVDLSIGSADVLSRLFSESTHPPLYFWLTHWWIKLFLANGVLVSLEVGRSLSAIFGGLAIPAIFGLSWITFRDRLTAHLTAILMTVSPYGIYLAQEARHYTLSILWIIASVSCLIVAMQHLERRCKIPWWLCLIWIVVNSLGIATHYFFALALGIEGLIILGFWFWQRHQPKNQPSFNAWLPIIVVGLGTLVGCLVWVPVAMGISSHELTDWIETSYDLDEIWQPIPRLVAWWITMVVLLPIEGVPLAIAICSGVLILLGLIWIIPALIKSWQLLLNSSVSLVTKLLSGYLFIAIVLYLFLIYGYGKDVSLAARYHFVYFPVVIVMLSAILTRLWQTSNFKNKNSFDAGKNAVVMVLLMGFLGSLTVVNDFGFQKSRRSNLLAQQMQSVTNVPAVVATTYQTLSELRELIALALALETNSSPNQAISSQFLLLQRNEDHDSRLKAILSSQPKPLDLWGINLKANDDALNQAGCILDEGFILSDSGYRNRFYHCR